VTLIFHACRWLAQSWIGTQIRESDNLFSAIETVHVLGVAVSAGTIAIADLALLGIIFTRFPIREVLQPVVRITWIGFGVMAVSGILLFWSEADKLYDNAALRLKMLLLLALGANQWLFHRRAARSRQNERVQAVLSLSLWVGVIVLGRAIAYL
jgi:predicted exporter